MTQNQAPGENLEESPETAAEGLGLAPLPPGEVLLVIVGAGASHDCIPLSGDEAVLHLDEPQQRRRIEHQLVGSGFSSFLAEEGRLDWLLEEPVDWPRW